MVEHEAVCSFKLNIIKFDNKIIKYVSTKYLLLLNVHDVR